MALTFTLDGTALPLVDGESGFTLDYTPMGVSFRVWDGSYKVDNVASKWRGRLQWTRLTAAERSTLWTEYAAALSTAKTLVLPDGKSLSVMTGLGSWREKLWYDGAGSTAYYDISFEWEEV